MAGLSPCVRVGVEGEARGSKRVWMFGASAAALIYPWGAGFGAPLPASAQTTGSWGRSRAQRFVATDEGDKLIRAPIAGPFWQAGGTGPNRSAFGAPELVPGQWRCLGTMLRPRHRIDIANQRPRKVENIRSFLKDLNKDKQMQPTIG